MIPEANVAKVICFSHAAKEVLHELFGPWRKSLTVVLCVGYEHNFAKEDIVEIQDLVVYFYVFYCYTCFCVLGNNFDGLKAFDEVELTIILLLSAISRWFSYVA